MNITQRQNLACAIFTAAMLEEAKACQPQIDLFRALFGESVVVTVARAHEVSDQFDWEYAARFLDAVGQAEYERVQDLALAEYRRVRASAWASAYIATRKRALPLIPPPPPPPRSNDHDSVPCLRDLHRRDA